MTLDLARALTGRLSAREAYAHAQAAAERFSSFGAPGVPMPTSEAQIVACVRLARAVEYQSFDTIAEREARAVLKGYPKQPIASYILLKALGRQKRWGETTSYWEAAAVLPGPAGDEARKQCAYLFPDRKEFQMPPQKSLGERSGPITQDLIRHQQEVDAEYERLTKGLKP